ncbi:MAG: hypothetical protein ABW222_13485 [Actinomycetota bacterium]
MTQRIYVGTDEDEALVLRNLFGLLGPDQDQRLIVWVAGERAVDVPDEVAEAYTAPTTKPKTKAAKAAPAPAATSTPDPAKKE